MNDDPSKAWDRYCQQQEDIELWESVVDVGVVMQERGIDFSPIDASNDFIWFINAKITDCKFSTDVITGERVCINHPTLKAPWNRSDGEIDLAATADAVVEAICVASGPKTPPFPENWSLPQSLPNPPDNYDPA
jgi:hypothetical protein